MTKQKAVNRATQPPLFLVPPDTPQPESVPEARRDEYWLLRALSNAVAELELAADWSLQMDNFECCREVWPRLTEAINRLVEQVNGGDGHE